MGSIHELKYAQILDIKQLIEASKDSQAISIFIPTHRISLPHNLKADRVRMKNAIRDIVAHFENQNMRTEEIMQYVEKLHKIQADYEFWKYRDNGIAIYAKKDKAIFYDLPLEIEPSVHIGERFIISPLLAGIKDNYRYYLLDLNLQEPRFFVASQSGMDRILNDNLPGEIKTALRIDEYQEQLQHSTSPGGSRDAHHHGHGGENDHKFKDIEKYFRLIDSVLHEKILKNSNLPLIVAGDRKSIDSFKQISSYNHFSPYILEGNNQRTNEDDLHKQSWDLMCRHLEKQENLFSSLFERAKFRDDQQAMVNGEHIKKAAYQGRVATLAISIVHRTYDSVVRRMERRFKIALPSNARQLNNIEQATRAVLQNGGDVRALLYSGNGNNEQYIKAIVR